MSQPALTINWNSVFSRWEISFDVVGFSGFVLQTQAFVLPVNLLSFAAQPGNNSALVNWKIASPLDGTQFTLERSTNGTDFTTINAQQGDMVKTQFNYSDQLNQPGRYYYRLRMTERNGDVSYSNTIFVDQGTNSPRITIYPNPVKKGGHMGINLQNKSIDKLEIRTLTGQLVLEDASVRTGSFTVNLPSSMSAGVYFVRLFTKEEILVERIRVE